jgi:hypothetical protein
MELTDWEKKEDCQFQSFSEKNFFSKRRVCHLLFTFLVNRQKFWRENK